MHNNPIQKCKSRTISRSGSMSDNKINSCIGFLREYEEGLAMRNFQLNDTVNCLLVKNGVLEHGYQLQRRKSMYEKQQLLTAAKYHKKNLQQTKTTLTKLHQSQILVQHNTNSMYGNLKLQLEHYQTIIHELNIRLNQNQMYMKRCLEEKDVIIIDLRNRIEVYEKQSKKLKEQRDLLKIQEFKVELDGRYGKGRDLDKEEKDRNRSQQLLRQKIQKLEKQNQQLNQQLENLQAKVTEQQQQLKKNHQQIKELRRIVSTPKIQSKQKSVPAEQIKKIEDIQQISQIESCDEVHRKKQGVMIFQLARGEGLIASIITLRNGINKEMMELFIACVTEADKKKTNSLAIFINKWRTIEISRIQPYVQAYFQATEEMKLYLNAHKSQDYQNKQLFDRIKTALPVQLCYTQPKKLPQHLRSKAPFVFKTHLNQLHTSNIQTRSQINLWVLSTVQFTNNQQAMSTDRQLKTNFLYLFRLLSVEYRVMYPPRGKEQAYTMDTDVRNCLLHYIVDGVHKVILSI